MKRCGTCGEDFPVTREYFHWRVRGQTLVSSCISCVARRSKTSYEARRDEVQAQQAIYRDANRESLRTYFRRYNQEHAEKRAAQGKAHREANIDEARAAQRARYQRDKAAYVERARRWALANPEKAKAHTTKKNHRRRGATPDAEAREYMQILSADPCSYCGAQMREFDHIIAVSTGGTGAWDNLTAACRPCNAAKADRTLLGFLMRSAA
jgi:5-methylcytosine-specific restriction endonuclease McrA